MALVRRRLQRKHPGPRGNGVSILELTASLARLVHYGRDCVVVELLLGDCGPEHLRKRRVSASTEGRSAEQQTANDAGKSALSKVYVRSVDLLAPF